MKATSMDTSRREHEDRRERPRVRLQLKLAMIYPQHAGRPARPMFHGKTYNIGMSGLSMVVSYNVFQEGEVAVVLALPPAYAEAPRKVVAATAEMTYAIHSSKLDAFRIGLAFREFRGDGEKLLEAVLRQALNAEDVGGLQYLRTRSGANRPTDSQPFGG